MTLYQVAVEAAIHLHASFEVYEVADMPRAEVRFIKGFGDCCNTVLAAGDLFNSEASAVMRKALVGLQIAGNGRGYPEDTSRTLIRNGFHPPNSLYYACKHGCKNADNLIKLIIFAIPKN
jgi:hypothetical protein